MLKLASEKIKRAYNFFKTKEISKESFTKEEIIQNTGWKESTVAAYISKKWSGFLKEIGNDIFKISGIANLPFNVFERMYSQKANLSDPLKPEIPEQIENLINKSRESVLLAVQIYNNPTISFRTHGYMVFMVIAYTALFHAIFERDGIDYFYKNKDGQYKINDEQKMAWELKQCIQTYYGNKNNAVKANLILLINLRNIIEHKYLPALDMDVSGFCQALLINYEKMLTGKFSKYFAINHSLEFSLQFSEINLEQQIQSRKNFMSKEYEYVRNYIKGYKESLPDEIVSSPEFNFRVYMIPIIGNHAKSADYAIQFINYDPNNPEEMAEYEKDVAFIRFKQVPVSNKGNFKAKQVSVMVEEALCQKFRVHDHTKAWKMYGIRKGIRQSTSCNTDYCIYDEVHGDFVYTKKWVAFLIDKLNNEEEYKRLCQYKIP